MTQTKLLDEKLSLFYGGGWVRPTGGRSLGVISPATRAFITEVPDAGPDDVAAAAASAAAAAPLWTVTDPAERARLLRALAEILRARIGSLAELESTVTGRPIREMLAQMSRIPEWLEYFAGIILGLEGEANRVKGGLLTYTSLEPYGVCALLTPWNHPVLILVKKLAAALAAGNCCLVKPSELAPVSPLVLAGWCQEAGFPPGVVNVVTGGAETGRAVCAADPVRRIDVTGGTATGKRIAAAAAERLVPCTLELGGNAPIIIDADVNLDEAVAGATFAAFVAAGQTCVSAKRFLVAAAIHDVFAAKFAARARTLRLGHPLDMATDMGPLISEAAQRNCLSQIARAEAAGARVIAGGGRPEGLPSDLANGFYVAPTILTRVDPGSALFQEELFGPVVSVTPFETEDQAVALANATPYALGAGIWTNSIHRAHRLAARLAAGVIWINDHHKNDPRSVWGGWGDSGYGKENGWDALRSYMKKKSVVVRTNAGFDDWFAGGQRYG